jgi:hypothetical protein
MRYQYLQMLPQLAKGDANEVFVIPSEFSQAVRGIGEAFGRGLAGGAGNHAVPEDSAESE